MKAFLLTLSWMLATMPLVAADPTPETATKEAPFVNSLGIKFVPVPITGGPTNSNKILFSVWDTRVTDWRRYAEAANSRIPPGMWVLKVKKDEKRGCSFFWELDSSASWEQPGFEQTDDHPVVGVSWQDVKNFCAWLSKTEGRTYRLPTDAEWSAAVGLTKYPWGEGYPPPKGAGNYADDSFLKNAHGANWPQIPGDDGYPRTSPVGRFTANRLGLFDMGGNVWQWCEDEYRARMNEPDLLKAHPALEEERADDGTHYRVFRGASWSDGVERYLRSSFLIRALPTFRIAYGGFRCVLVVSGGQSKPQVASEHDGFLQPGLQGDQTALSALTGAWCNKNFETGNITRFNIRSDGAKIIVHMWGRCHPKECDWGETAATLGKDHRTLSLTWNPGFAITTQTIMLLTDGSVELTTHSHYTGDSSRKDHDTADFYSKDLIHDWTEAPSLPSVPGLAQNVPSPGSIPLTIVESKDVQIIHSLNFLSGLDTDLAALYQHLRKPGTVRFENNASKGGEAIVVVKHELTKSEALELIRTWFITNGYTVKSTGDEEVIRRGSSSVDVPIVFDPTLLPADASRVVTFAFELKHAKPVDLATMIRARLADSPSPSARVLALSQAKLILVTERVDAIQKLQELIRQQDVSGAAELSVMSVTAVTFGDPIHLNLLSAGAMPKMGGYSPQRLRLSSEKPAEIKQLPPGLSAPLFGVLKLGPAEIPTRIAVVLDEPDGEPARLYVNANANGDLQDDPPAVWTSRIIKSKDGLDLTQYSGGANVTISYGKAASSLHLAMYRFDKNDPSRAAQKDFIFYYSDYAREGDITLGDKTYKAMLVDRMASGDFRGTEGGKSSEVQLFIDVNGDGKFHPTAEVFDVLQPFNIGGATYEVAGMTASGDSFRLEKSTKTVSEVKVPEAPSVGKKAFEFKAKTTAGQEVSFPLAYQGKLVILDFWATWCGPCVAELPHLLAAYDRFHSQGLEVLGVSLDQSNAAQKLETFTKERKMAWPQVFDGNAWSAEVAKLYDIRSIPSAFLVDGDSGVILAAGASLRGEGLEKTLEEAVAKKKAR